MEKFKSTHKNIPIILLIVFIAGRCFLLQEEGQKQPLLSPSGNYTVEMPIYDSNIDLYYPVWTPTIRNRSGELIYTDRSSNLSGYHNSYWSWNTNNVGNDVLWVYNSDFGEVTMYYLNDGKWEKTKYDIEQGELNPPEIINKKIYRY
jgi:hypothetical protein